jgi:serine/threonine-protein phosphatase 2A activator
MQVSRIYQLKIGPFFEHSSQLHAIAQGVPNWEKVNAGMLKMYEAEVLSKRVVVQHLPLGGLVVWESHEVPEEKVGDDEVGGGVRAVGLDVGEAIDSGRK